MQGDHEDHDHQPGDNVGNTQGTSTTGPGQNQPGGGGRKRRRRGRRRGRGGAPGGGGGGGGGGQHHGQHGGQGEVSYRDPMLHGDPERTTPLPAEPGLAPGVPPRDEMVQVEGALDLHDRGHGWLRRPERSFLAEPSDAEVHRGLVDKYHLRHGVLIAGQALSRGGKRILQKIESIEGQDPEKFALRVPFHRLTSIDPFEKLNLEFDPKDMVSRVLDLIAPVGKGQRGLIVSPPKAGKTIMLMRIAQAIAQNHPEVVLMVLLVDERPEEVTDMRRSVKGSVFASSSDRPTEEHLKVAEMTMARAQRIAEGGGDVVILLDSITRLARAYNKEIESSGRTLSGGVDSRAMERPKRLFGGARKLEEGGSLTILGTTLVDTGSRMDEVIFEEFKGTGNMEVVLSRQLAEKRIFPAIDIPASGTRKEEKLLKGWEYEKIKKIRIALHPLKPVEAMERMLKAMEGTKSNADFLQAI